MAQPQPADYDEPLEVRILSRLSRSDIVAATSHGAAGAGERLWRKGTVREFSVGYGNGSLVITASWRGSDRKLCKPVIDVCEDRGKFIIDGRCSCPVRRKCEHVAALLFTVSAALKKPGDEPVKVAPASGSKGKRGAPSGGVPTPNPVPVSTPQPAPAVLDPRLSAWFDALVSLERTASEEYPDDVDQRH